MVAHKGVPLAPDSALSFRCTWKVVALLCVSRWPITHRRALARNYRQDCSALLNSLSCSNKQILPQIYRPLVRFFLWHRTLPLMGCSRCMDSTLPARFTGKPMWWPPFLPFTPYPAVFPATHPWVEHNSTPSDTSELNSCRLAVLHQFTANQRTPKARLFAKKKTPLTNSC